MQAVSVNLSTPPWHEVATHVGTFVAEKLFAGWQECNFRVAQMFLINPNYEVDLSNHGTSSHASEFRLSCRKTILNAFDNIATTLVEDEEPESTPALMVHLRLVCIVKFILSGVIVTGSCRLDRFRSTCGLYSEALPNTNCLLQTRLAKSEGNSLQAGFGCL